MNRQKTLLIFGATGMVGQQLLTQALATDWVSRIIAPTRRPLAPHDKLENPIIDFEALPESAPWWKADAMLCALGTTIKQAGSKQAFRHIDHGLVLQTAKMAKSAGTPCFVLNSSMGADPRSGNFYLKVKGELEADVTALDFESLSARSAGPRCWTPVNAPTAVQANNWACGSASACQRSFQNAISLSARAMWLKACWKRL